MREKIRRIFEEFWLVRRGYINFDVKSSARTCPILQRSSQTDRNVDDSVPRASGPGINQAGGHIGLELSDLGSFPAADAGVLAERIARIIKPCADAIGFENSLIGRYAGHENDNKVDMQFTLLMDQCMGSLNRVCH